MNIKKYDVQYIPLGDKIEARIDGEIYGVYADMSEAQDTIEDFLYDALSLDNKYKCEFCKEYFQEEEVKHRLEDSRFTAPYGSAFVMGGDVATVAVCPVCKDDLEVC